LDAKELGSGDFWIVYAARNNFAFDAMYWQKIDQRSFGTTCIDPDYGWKKRLDMLEPYEKQDLEKCVKLKLEQMETGVLAWIQMSIPWNIWGK
jgi:hypothetical protein